jgi:Family of unknown function (DUF5681)
MPFHVDDEPYEVGYGKPPELNRFKKGKSGNPKGRPKREPDDIDVEHLFIEELFETVTVNIGGRSQTLPAWKVIAKRLVAECMKGNIRAIRMYREFTDQFKLISAKKKTKKEDDNRRLIDMARNELNNWDPEYATKKRNEILGR